jgi:hypothetical protein
MKQPEGQLVVMKLIEDGPQRVVPPVVIAHEPLPPLPPLELEPAVAETNAPPPAASESPPAAEPPIDAS